MTKGSQINLSSRPEKEDNFTKKVENPISKSTHTVSDPYLHSSTEKKAKRGKRKVSITASKSSISSSEKKKGKVKSNNNHQKPDNQPQTKVQKKLPSNFARLAPSLHRSCPDNLLQIESFKSDKQDSNKENSSSPQFAAFEAPVRPQRFQGGTSKRLQSFERQRKTKETFSSSSNTVTQGTTPAKSLLEKNCSTPNLVISSLCNNTKRFEPLFTFSSQTIASEFPDVVQFYKNEFLRGRLPHYLGSKRNWNVKFNPSLLAPKKTLASFAPYPKTPTLSSSSSQSAPNTPPTLQNISGRGCKKRTHLPLGAVVSCNSFQDFGVSKVSSASFGLDENSINTQSEVSSCTTQEEDKSSKQFSENTLTLFASIGKAMNSKSNQQISANQKTSQPLLQYHTGRTRPRVAKNFSSSFILPYGLGGRVQSSPVSTPAIPSSSSFHGGPLESLQLMSENHRSTARQQSQCSNGQRQRKYIDRQKIKMLKPLGVNKNQNNIAKLYDISTSEFSAAILPEMGTTSYRLTHDVSFDEGSRYRTTDFPHGFKGKDDLRGQHMNVNGLTHHFGSSVSMRGSEAFGAANQSRQDSRNHEHTLGNSANFKDAVPISLIRMEDRFAGDLPPATSPSSPAMSSAIAASASTSSFIPPPSASRPNPAGATAISGGNITFRLHKEKQNWNYRLGELSINGGGYTNPPTVSSNPKQDLEAINPINMTSAVQRNLQTRERAMAAVPKSRMSSRYSSKTDSNGVNASYSDPCISAPPSFQQRLTDLSILESETIKYERNRKLRRKKNQDKDS